MTAKYKCIKTKNFSFSVLSCLKQPLVRSTSLLCAPLVRSTSLLCTGPRCDNSSDVNCPAQPPRATMRALHTKIAMHNANDLVIIVGYVCFGLEELLHIIFSYLLIASFPCAWLFSASVQLNLKFSSVFNNNVKCSTNSSTASFAPWKASIHYNRLTKIDFFSGNITRSQQAHFRVIILIVLISEFTVLLSIASPMVWEDRLQQDRDLELKNWSHLQSKVLSAAKSTSSWLLPLLLLLICVRLKQTRLAEQSNSVNGPQ